MIQENFENMFLKIREENPKNKIILKYGAEKLILDGEANIIIENGWLKYININGGTVRYIDIASIYEVEVNKD